MYGNLSSVTVFNTKKQQLLNHNLLKAIYFKPFPPNSLQRCINNISGWTNCEKTPMFLFCLPFAGAN